MVGEPRACGGGVMSDEELIDDGEDEIAERRRLAGSGRTGPTTLGSRLAAVTKPSLPTSFDRHCGTCSRAMQTSRHIAECMDCEGKRTGEVHERTARAIRDYKQVAERSGSDERLREAYLQVQALCGKGHAEALARATGERLATRKVPAGRRGLD